VIAWACRHALGWFAVVMVIAVVASHRAVLMPPQRVAPAPAAAAPQPASAVSSLTFHAEKNGHVYLGAAVNGTPIRMMVDTGATMVILSKEDAAAAGVGPLHYSMTVNTVNGSTRAAPVTLREVRIGQLEIDNVQGLIVEHLKTPSLLGQSFLNRLDSYQMRDGVLTMSW
jgi:aspartyl protease family protein